METINHQTNSYLLFKLGAESYAAHESKVLNILEMADITRVSKSPVMKKDILFD